MWKAAWFCKDRTEHDQQVYASALSSTQRRRLFLVYSFFSFIQHLTLFNIALRVVGRGKVEFPRTTSYRCIHVPSSLAAEPSSKVQLPERTRKIRNEHAGCVSNPPHLSWLTVNLSEAPFPPRRGSNCFPASLK